MGGLVVQRYLCEERRTGVAVLLASLVATGALPLLSRVIRIEPWAVLHSLTCVDLRHLIRDRDRVGRLLFLSAADIAVADACHAALGSESLHALIDLLMPRLDFGRTSGPVAVLAAGADAIFTSIEVEAMASTRTAATWGGARQFAGMGHDMMLEPACSDAADELSRLARGIAENHLGEA